MMRSCVISFNKYFEHFIVIFGGGLGVKMQFDCTKPVQIMWENVVNFIVKYTKMSFDSLLCRIVSFGCPSSIHVETF